jgi:iron uptake system component EfeO
VPSSRVLRALAVPVAAGSLAGVAVVPAGAAVPASDRGVHTVKVRLTDAGCPAKLSVTAGPTTFEVANDGAEEISEFEVLDGDHILGEVENLAPGLDGKFSLTLKAGKYTTSCPGGDRSKGKLVVKGGTEAALTPAGRAAVEQYRSYVVDQTNQLVPAAQTFVDAVVAGDVAAAKAAYGPARVPYERIEPVAETFGDLDPRIDARAGDVSEKKWSGFHKIERALFVDGTTEGMAPVAQQLLKDVQRLQSLVPDVELEPATIANGAVELLNEVASSKITGEEERYSRLDLVDFDANVQGSKGAYDAVRPILATKNPALAGTIDARFAAVDTALNPYRDGASFVLYTALDATDTKTLAQAVDALAEPLSKVARQVVSTKR